MQVKTRYHPQFPLKKDVILHFDKLEFPSPKNVLCQVWLKLVKWFWIFGEEDENVKRL